MNFEMESIMPDDLELQAEAIFNQIIALPVADRPTATEKACIGNPVLLARVRALLDAAEQAGGFLVATTADRPGDSPAINLDEKIGPYKLLQPIGEGGFGTVYMAEQSHSVKRRVALKIIKLGMDTKDVVARFEAERQALAMMDHPNIARVFDAGATTSGRPFFVMELVNGIPITTYCDAAKMTTRERLELMIPVCRAVQSAHQKGVIHRDLKPSNVLVTEHDGKPVPKVIDFGIAKATGQALTDKTLFTRFQQFIGTPVYMSPEQAGLSGLDIDTRADVYGLGVLLYELLTGTTPVDPQTLRAAAYDQMCKIIRETEPAKPSTKLTTLGNQLATIAASRGTDIKSLSQIIRGELDWIVMKSLEKDRNRRYDTAAALADDLHRHLSNEPVNAAPPSWTYRAQKFTRKHKTPLLAGAALAALLGSGVIATTWQWRRAESNATIAVEQKNLATAERTKADDQREAAETESYIANLALGQAAIQADRWLEARQRLDACPESKRGWEWKFLHNLAKTVQFKIPDVVGRRLDLSPDGRILVTRDNDIVKLWRTDLKGADPSTLRLSGLGDFTRPYSSCAFRFSNDDRILTAILAEHSHVFDKRNPLAIGQWDIDTRNPLTKPKTLSGTFNAADLSPDGSQIATDCEGVVQVFDTRSGLKSGLGFNPGFKLENLSFATPDLVACEGGDTPESGNKFVQFWNASTSSVASPRIPCLSFSVSPDHLSVATFSDLASGSNGRHEAILKLSRISNGANFWMRKLQIVDPMYWYANPTFSADGSLVAHSLFGVLQTLNGELIGGWSASSGSGEFEFSAASDSTGFSPQDGRIFEAHTGRPLAQLADWNRIDIVTLSFLPNNHAVETVEEHNTEMAPQYARVIDLNDADTPATPYTENDECELEAQLALSADSGPASPSQPISEKEKISASTPDGSRIAVADGQELIRFYETNGMRELVAVPVETAVTQLRFTPDGTRLIINFADGTMEIWDTRDYAARQKDRDIRFAEIPSARNYLNKLLATHPATDELKNFIRTDSSISTLRKLVALERLEVEVRKLKATTRPATTQAVTR